MSLNDRQNCIKLVAEAHASGARREKCCEALEISLRRLQRWEKSPDEGDRRAGPNRSPANRLTPEEREEVIKIANRPEYCDLPPSQIVPILADRGRYVASESSFYRILKAERMLAHRSKSSPMQKRDFLELTATAPNQVWSWDITYLRSTIRGKFYYLYLPMDLFSRFIVHWEIHEVESSELSAQMIERACQKQGVERGQIYLHSDNGGPMKGATMLATLQRLGIMPSFSRPSVSDDNPYSESLFKTMKYCSQYPDRPFDSLTEARIWMETFVHWYNEEHLHSGISFVTPYSRHYGLDNVVLDRRITVYETAKARNPERWSGSTRKWARPNVVYLNKRQKTKKEEQKLAA